MKIKIKDDFDLRKIVYSGQCFRPVENEGIFRFITGGNILYISECGPGEFEVSCTEEEWNKIWASYFDLDRNYSKIRSLAKGDNFLDAAADFGKGIRILKQDPWEMLISYIISQRKSIPAIRTSIERICECCGTKTDICVDAFDITQCVNLFPTPHQLLNADLSDCGLGYRLPYLREAARMVAEGEIDLETASTLDDEELFSLLNQIKGVGTKVANCVMLFGYARCGRAPVDVWISRIIDNEYDGKNPFPRYGDVAGIMQQYGFYYMLSRK